MEFSFFIPSCSFLKCVKVRFCGMSDGQTGWRRRTEHRWNLKLSSCAGRSRFAQIVMAEGSMGPEPHLPPPGWHRPAMVSCPKSYFAHNFAEALSSLAARHHPPLGEGCVGSFRHRSHVQPLPSLFLCIYPQCFALSACHLKAQCSRPPPALVPELMALRSADSCRGICLGFFSKLSETC